MSRSSPSTPVAVSIPAAFEVLRASGTESVLVEGGSDVITALLAERLVDRLIVGVAPIVIGAGTEAVNSLGVERIAEGIRLDEPIDRPRR